MKRFLFAGALTVTTIGGGAMAACNPSGLDLPSPEPTSRPTSTVDAALPPPPPTVQASAPGLCGTWTTTPVDLSAVGAPLGSSKLRVHGDARGGFTVADVDANGTWTAAAFTSKGVIDGPTLVVPATAPSDAGPDSDAAASARTYVDSVATPGGWVVSYSAQESAALVSQDTAGNVLATAPVAAPNAGGTLDGEADGTVLVTSYEGSAGWLSPTDRSSIDFTFTAEESLFGWNDGVFYAFDDITLRTATESGTTRAIPSTTGPIVSYTWPAPQTMLLVPGVGGTSALIMVAPTAPATTAKLVFVAAASPDAVFDFDEEVDAIAGAPRDQSGGAVLTWTTSGLTAAGGIAYGFTEVAPSGARGAVQSLGNEVVDASLVLIARSGDGAAYLTVAQNVHDREAFLLTCADAP